MKGSNKNSKELTLIIFGIFIWLLPMSGISQSLNVQIDVNPEVQTTVERNLDFGQVITGMGLQSIPPGSNNMGIFRVRALRTQRVILQMDADEALLHENPDVLDSIPIDLQAAYTNFGMEDFELSTPLSGIGESIVLETSMNNPSSEWSSLYVYVFGNVDIGNVREGVYTGEVILTVIYE
ncbi:MAG: hypothetical protein U5K35_15645 [Rhodohalobacter sp.]|nr:hypothetical protein [Rhodohalobacter sp.]